MSTSNEKQECIHQLAACVYKHNGRFDGTTIIMSLNNNDIVKFIQCRPADVVFVSQNDIDEFKKSCNDIGFTVVREDSFDRCVVSKCVTNVYNDFEELKNNYSGNLNTVKYISGQYHCQTPVFTFKVDLLLERSVFRVPFNEFKDEYLTVKPISAQNVTNLNSKRLTIDWNALFNNYEKFNNIKEAIKEFSAQIEYYRPTGYCIYNNDKLFQNSIDTITAELNAHMTSKAPKEEYTIEQAKKDLETGRQLMDQANAMIQKATGRLIE